jgi:hypothetical protein
VYADPIPTEYYVCPQGYTPQVLLDAVNNNIVPKGTICEKTTPDTASFSASASAQAGATLCVNNATVGVGAIGSGSAGSTESEADAQTKAQAIANANALANLNAEKGKYPGASASECPPGVVQTASVVAPAAAVSAPAAATIAKPSPAKVSAPAPGSVSAGVAVVPSKATVPSSVPAGDGSQAPGLPLWALAMIAVGVLGAGAAGKSVLASRK